ncbi:hypothetical protein KO494_10845 [Lacinutrix sp. C3R15]|uniref:type IX secretion system protein PorG n=1 Tax=Flavobacteriaceae TaxID=49546 RepID=UPI001C09CE00|nr:MULTISPECIES: DUF6089 family protein [Flavobacteriaceae]MBU2940035.1 hypothetical protein [Lacinutrix sp. C3R15]MDO6623352.1 DUF6089 family protein [Oceanihabitans sp. 1_MG-2023]
MRYFIIILISALTFQLTQAQTYEIGLYAGGSNFIGDVGATNYISPNKPAIGGIFKWNRSARHSFRFSLIYTELEALDSKSDDPRRIERDYKFTNPIIEASVGLEFTFFDFNLHSRKTNATPYLYTGITVAKHDNFHFSNSGELIDDQTSSLAYGLPMVLGYKFQIAQKFILAAEIGARYTFTDEIDGSVPDAEEAYDRAAFGNLNNNDWYMFTGITLTYTFGETPCYCSF